MFSPVSVGVSLGLVGLGLGSVGLPVSLTVSLGLVGLELGSVGPPVSVRIRVSRAFCVG